MDFHYASPPIARTGVSRALRWRSFKAVRSSGDFVIPTMLMCSLVWASDTVPSHLYQLTTETGMPHLEENLRYSIIREERCLAPKDVPSTFSLLRHVALEGCKLREETRRNDTVSYRLVCDGGNATTGRATWVSGEHQMRGRLDVKLGGKNMTVYQRVTARPRGKCVREPR